MDEGQLVSQHRPIAVGISPDTDGCVWSRLDWEGPPELATEVDHIVDNWPLPRDLASYTLHSDGTCSVAGRGVQPLSPHAESATVVVAPPVESTTALVAQQPEQPVELAYTGISDIPLLAALALGAIAAGVASLRRGCR